MKVSNYKFSLTFITGIICIGVFILIVFFTSIHFNPVQNKHNYKRLVYTLVPQGWAFFTRNAREAQTMVYRVNGDQLELLHHRHSCWHNFFGLSRRTTVYFSEIQGIRSQLTDTDFMSSKWNFQANKTGEFPTEKVEVKNNIANPLLCGDYVLVFQKHVPWAWSKNIDKIDMPAKVARVEVACQ